MEEYPGRKKSNKTQHDAEGNHASPREGLALPVHCRPVLTDGASENEKVGHLTQEQETHHGRDEAIATLTIMRCTTVSIGDPIDTQTPP